MKKPVFIYSLHRSGSTYLQNIIDSSNEIKMLDDEVHFDHPFFIKTFRKLFKKVCNNRRDKYDKFLTVLKNTNVRGSFWKKYKMKYENYNGSKKYLTDNNIITVWDSFNSILKQILYDSNKQRIGIKYPAHYKYFQIFNQQYRDSKNIFLIRNPRAIIASKIISPTNKRINKSNVITYNIVRLITVIYFALEYKYFLSVIEKNIQYGLLIKYEELVLQKENTIKEMCEYLEISMNHTMFDTVGKSSGYVQVDNDYKNVYKWKKVLRKYEIKIIQLIIKNKVISYYEE